MAKGSVGRFRRANARGQLENILNLTDHTGDGSKVKVSYTLLLSECRNF